MENEKKEWGVGTENGNKKIILVGKIFLLDQIIL